MLTEKHLTILQHLREDARISLAEISRKTGIATSTIFDYYQDLAEHTIIRHTALTDFAKLGYALRKKYLIRTENRKKAFEWLQKHSAVNNIYRVDTHDAFFEAFFPDVNSAEEFRHELKQALKPKELKEFDVLEELRQEAFMPFKEKA